MLVEVNHAPSGCEPHTLTPTGIVEALAPEFVVSDVQIYRESADGMYQSIQQNNKVPDPMNFGGEGYFSAKFTRRP